jgi:hypothetical protein
VRRGKRLGLKEISGPHLRECKQGKDEGERLTPGALLAPFVGPKTGLYPTGVVGSTRLLRPQPLLCVMYVRGTVSLPT